MKKLQLISLIILPFLLSAQITVVKRGANQTKLIGKISHTSAYQKAGLSRNLPILDPLTEAGDIDKINSYKEIKKNANQTFKTVGIRKMALIDEEFSASLIYFKEKNEYLLTFQNSEYNYQNESFWISDQTKNELYNLIISELNQRHKFKNIEVILGNNIVLVLSINRKKISFNLWDGYSWVQSYWYREFKVSNLFGY
jgi:hypothetical protein